jgi:hypothetical protein
MPHFVHIPARPNSPAATSLAIKDPRGDASIAVWAAERDWTIQCCQPGPAGAYSPIYNPRFQSKDFNKDTNKFVYFTLYGLKKGDFIAAYDANNAPQTAPLPVTFVSTDRPSNNFASRASKTFPSSFMLNPAGTDQAAIKTTAQEWIDDIEAVLAYIKNNRVGSLIVNSVPSTDLPLNIWPYLEGYEQAWSDIRFSRKTWQGHFAAGFRPNEVLFHEICHRAENPPSYQNCFDFATGTFFSFGSSKDDPFANDFFSVTASNVYASLYQRPIRKDHGTEAMPLAFSNRNDGPARFRMATLANFLMFEQKNKALNNAIANIAAPWNPFRVC